MKPMSLSTGTIAVLATAFPSSIEATLQWVFDENPYCNNGLALDAFALDCSDSGDCYFGAEVEFSATLTSLNGFSAETQTTKLEACLTAYGICYTLAENAVDVCNDGIFTSTGGQDCPAAGSYYVTNSFTLPGSDSWAWAAGLSVYANVIIEDSYGTTSGVCHIKGTIQDSNSSSDAQARIVYGAASAAFLGAAVIGGLAIRKRRRVQVEQASGSEESQATNFEMMKDPVSGARIV